VFGVPAGDIGDAVYAVVSPLKEERNGAALKASLEAECRKTLPSYMMPRVLVLNELPRSPNGKLDRTALKQMCKHVHEEWSE